jgi:dipeptidyl aminopeptidase/acylaminoacyl peptidase
MKEETRNAAPAQGEPPAAEAGLGEPVEVSFKAAVDGTTQKYVIMLPKNFDAGREHPLIIGLHGHGFDRWQYIRESRDECRGVRDVAAKYDAIFVSPDYRAPTSWMGPKAEADVVQIIADLRREYKVSKVILTGGSMGGTGVLTFAAIHPDLVDGVASLNGTGNLLEYRGMDGVFKESFGGTKAEIPAEYKLRSAEYWPERLTMPIAFTAGGKDEGVPPHSVLRMADVLTLLGRKVLMIYRPDTGHETNYADTVSAAEFAVRGALGLATGTP